MSKFNDLNPCRVKSELLRCLLCGEEICHVDLFEHPVKICSACYQEEIRERFSYDGDLL